jgi:hypothetical protein
MEPDFVIEDDVELRVTPADPDAPVTVTVTAEELVEGLGGE